MKRRKILLLRIAISAGLVLFLYGRVDLRALLALLAGMRPLLLLAIFPLLFFNTVISALKWKWLLQTDGITVPLPTLTASYLIGTFFNMFLPSNIGGDVYRVYDVARRSRRTVHSFASVLADRLSGFVALVTLGVGFGILGLRLLPDRQILWIPFLAMAALALMIAALFQEHLIRWAVARTPLSRFPALRSFSFKLFESVRQYRLAPRLFGKVMTASFTFQFGVITCIYLLARALGIELPFYYFCVFVPFVSLLEALPVSIFGLGIRDASYVFFLTRFNVTDVEALSLAMAYVLVTLIYAAAGGILFLLRPTTPSPQAQCPPGTRRHGEDTDIRYMRMALRQAIRAEEEGEVPVGAVIIHEDGRVLGQAHNSTETLKDPTAHAEILAITQAAAALGDWRLAQTALYVTKEPCPMCAGAIVAARIPRVVWGMTDSQRGGGLSRFRILQEPALNHRAEVRAGVLEAECKALVQSFFRARRANSR